MFVHTEDTGVNKGGMKRNHPGDFHHEAPKTIAPEVSFVDQGANALL